MAASAWIQHVMKYAKDNNIKFGDALSKAKATYKSQGSTKKVRNSTKSKKGKKRGKTARRK
jgi:predicted lipoprotein